VELALVHRRVELQGHVQIVRRPPRVAQELDGARVHLAGIDHRADAAVVCAVVLPRVVDRAREPGLALRVVLQKSLAAVG